MDRLGEIVRLNDDKLYSQLINYKYRAKGTKRSGHAASKEAPEDEDGLDGLEDKENKTNQDNQSSQSSGDTDLSNSDRSKNEQSLPNRHHHRHRKNRLKFKAPNLKTRDNVDKVSRTERTGRKFLKPDRTSSEPARVAHVNRLDRNSVNSIKSRLDDAQNSLVIDLEPIDRSVNRTNEELIRENGLADEMQDYLDLAGNGTTIDEQLNNEVKSEQKSKIGRKNEANSDLNRIRTEDSDEFDSIEIINLPVDETVDSQTNRTMLDEPGLASNASDSLVEYLDGTSLLFSDASNQLLLNELNQTDWQLSNDEKSLRKISQNNDTQSLLDPPQDDLDDKTNLTVSRTNADSNEGFLYELDLLEGNGALLSELADFGDGLIDDGQLTNQSELSDHQFINQQLIADKKLINQHNRLMDNHFVDQSHPKFSRLIGDADENDGGNPSTANLTMLAATVATLTNKMLLNLSAPNQLFTPNLILNTTGAYSNASLMLTPTSKPPTPAPFGYGLTILIAVLIGVASIITIVGNLLVSKLFLREKCL